MSTIHPYHTREEYLVEEFRSRDMSAKPVIARITQRDMQSSRHTLELRMSCLGDGRGARIALRQVREAIPPVPGGYSTKIAARWSNFKFQLVSREGFSSKSMKPTSLQALSLRKSQQETRCQGIDGDPEFQYFIIVRGEIKDTHSRRIGNEFETVPRQSLIQRSSSTGMHSSICFLN